VKYTLKRGQIIVADLRAILVKNEYNEDEYLTLKSDAPLITRLGGIMHDTCNTANLAAVRIIEAKNEAGIATFGREAWEALPPRGARDLRRALLQPHAPITRRRSAARVSASR
jgi:hypothetical protein